MVRAACAVVIAFTLASCDRLAPSAPDDAESTIRRAEIARLESKIDGLERQIESHDKQISTVRDLAIGTSGDLDSLRKTFNGNVEKDNKQAVREMTRAGVCGQETYLDNYNVTRLRNKECTDKDLRR